MKLAILVAMMALTASAWAQVMPTGAGRALDANNLMGGGGWNSVRLSEPLFDANRIVNGQITAGKSFQGSIGYRPANELRLDLPTRPMENFVRDSSGLPQVMSGVPVYEPTTYLRPSSTVLPAAALAAGVNSPGTSMPPANYTSAIPVQQLVTQTLKSYQQGQGMNVPMLPDMQLVSPDFARTMPELLSADNYLRPPTSTLFGVMAKPDQDKLTADMAGITDLSQSARMDYQWDMSREAAERARGERGKTDFDKTAENTRNRQQPKDQPLDMNHLPAPGQDVFVDMMLLMQKTSAANTTPVLPSEQAEPAKTPEPPAKPPAKSDDLEERFRAEQAARATAAAAKADRARAATATEAIGGQVIIHRLAGAGRDRYNTMLLLGQQALSQGEYYRAGSYFDAAVASGGGNPLGYLGGGLAMFGAQEPMSASLRIRAAMQVFPPLMQTMVDVEGLLGERVVTIRTRQLQTQLERPKPEPALMFLDAFLKANTSDTQAAADQAAKLLEVSSDPVHQAYAHALLRRAGRETTEQPAAAPAALPATLEPTTQP